MRKKWMVLLVVFIMVTQLIGGWSVAEEDPSIEKGVILFVKDLSDGKVEGADARVTHRVALTQEGERVGDYVPYELPDGPIMSDSEGKIVLGLEKDFNYIIQISKSDFMTTNIEVGHQQDISYRDVVLYGVGENGDLIVIPEEFLNIQQVEDGTGLNIGVSATIDGFEEAPSHFSALLKPNDYDLALDGLPYEMMYDIQPMDQTVERREPPGFYELMVFFFDAVQVGEHTEYILMGYSVKGVEVESSDSGPGPDPGTGPGQNLKGDLTFLIKNNEDITVETLVESYESMQRDMTVEVQALDAGQIIFPTHFLGKENPENPDESPVSKAITNVRFVGHTQPLDEPVVFDMDENPYWFISSHVNINNFGGSITGNVEAGFILNFSSSFERIVIDIEIEDSEPLSVVFYQPGFDEMMFHFEMTGEETSENISRTINLLTWQEWINVEVPEGLLEGRVRTTTTYKDGVTPLPDLLGGVWEYLADRSEIVRTWNQEIEGIFGINLDYQRYFGKVSIHFRFMVGNSEADAIVTFYESDFSGLDVWGPYSAGDWRTGITNISQPAEFLPTAFIYFLNQEVYLRPLDIGRTFTVKNITIKNDGVFVPVEFEYVDQEHIRGWRVALPDAIKDPVSNLKLTVEYDDAPDNDVDVPLQVRRVLFQAASFTYNEEDKAHFLGGNEDLWFEYTGEDRITFVTAFSYEPQGPHVPENEPFFPLDHKLLVIYYHFNRVLGSKQFSIVSNGNERNELIVHRLGGTMDAEFASVANANRITMFLIDRDGISAQNSSFGGATFGVGAGYGHLLPNHPNYGSGKDGMDYDY